MKLKDKAMLFLIGLTDIRMPLAILIFAMGCLALASIMTQGMGSHGGKWGQYCKEDNTCDKGLICVYDYHGHAKANRKSICLDPDTMKFSPLSN